MAEWSIPSVPPGLPQHTRCDACMPACICAWPTIQQPPRCATPGCGNATSRGPTTALVMSRQECVQSMLAASAQIALGLTVRMGVELH